MRTKMLGLLIILITACASAEPQPTLIPTPLPSYIPAPSPTPTSPISTITVPLRTITPPAIPPAVTGAPLNVILIVSDDQTWESIDKMPYLSTRFQWFRFTNAFLNVSLCCPSRANILSGLYSHHSGVEDNFDGENLSESSNLAVWLKDAGYHNALIGKYLNSFPWEKPVYTPPGWEEFQTFLGADDKSNWYYDYVLLENGTRVRYGSAPEDYSTDVLAQKAVDFLNSAREPFFLLFTPYTPHGPEIPAPRHINAKVGVIPRYPSFNEADVSDKPTWVRRLNPVDPQEMDFRRASKYRQALSLDEAIEKFVTTLERRNIFNRTVIIFMTDNGVALGEHRFVGKPCEFEECIKTPLIISYPLARIGHSKIITELVTNVDIAPSIAEMAGAQIPPLDGVSFVPLLEGRAVPNWREAVLLRWGGYDENHYRTFWGIRTHRYKYIELDRFNQKELYDLLQDPYELVNLADNPAYARIQTDLAQRLSKLKNQ